MRVVNVVLLALLIAASTVLFIWLREKDPAKRIPVTTAMMGLLGLSMVILWGLGLGLTNRGSELAPLVLKLASLPGLAFVLVALYDLFSTRSKPGGKKSK